RSRTGSPRRARCSSENTSSTIEPDGLRSPAARCAKLAICNIGAPRRARPLDGRRLDPNATSMHRWKPLSPVHFTLSMSSLERSMEFYTAVGFRVLRNNADVIWPDYVAQNFGLERAQGRGALLGIGDGPLETRLDLIQWLEPLARFPDPAQLATTVPRII